MNRKEILKTGKIVVKGKIRLLSPCHIGSGMDERTDMDLLMDSEGKPFIPASSFVGVLRHYFRKLTLDREIFNKFWGSEDQENPCQSSLYCKDLLISDEVKISTRDAVAIDNKKGIAKKIDNKKGAKYDFEIIERNTNFDLYMEIDLLEGYEEAFKRILATLIDILKNEKIRLGAKTRAGLGKIRLEDLHIYPFDFRNKEDILRWFKEDFSKEVDFLAVPYTIQRNGLFELKAQFAIKNSLIIRSYTGDPDAPDAVHITSSGEPVLTGTSLKGAIRARAERIINTIDKPLEIINDLFGYVREKTKEARASRITVEETLLPDYPSEVQTRIKIDRFTGGVMQGALLETKPLFSSKDEKVFEISIRIEDCKPHEAGLMLLILKDLWTGDLPVGGEKAIGRGVLRGKRAEITYDGKVYTIDEDLKITPAEAIKDLENLVKSLNNYPGGM